MNDHTDAELARLEHRYEMGDDTPGDMIWKAWLLSVENGLVADGATTVAQGVDGDEDVDGFSLDGAFEAFEDGTSATDYVYEVIEKRGKLGLPLVIKLRTATEEEQAMLDFASSRDQPFEDSATFFAVCFEEEALTINPNADHLRHLNEAIVQCFDLAYAYYTQQSAEGLA